MREIRFGVIVIITRGAVASCELHSMDLRVHRVSECRGRHTDIPRCDVGVTTIGVVVVIGVGVIGIGWESIVGQYQDVLIIARRGRTCRSWTQPAVGVVKSLRVGGAS